VVGANANIVPIAMTAAASARRGRENLRRNMTGDVTV